MASDTTAPTLTFLTLPGTVNVGSSGQTVTFTLGAIDDLSGVSSASIQFDKQVSYVSNGNTYTNSAFGFDTFQNSFSDGQSSYNVTLSSYTAPGTYNVSYLYVIDNTGNSHVYTGADLAALGLSTSFTVTGANASDDYAASTATTGTVAIGGSATGNIETTGDADWFKVTLTAGQTYEFKLEGSDTGQGTLQSPYLELRDSAGNALLGDQLSGGSGGPGPGWTALLTYTATTTGTYHLASDPFGNDIGTYKISATSLGAVADDYAASTATTGTVAIGGSATGNIETTGDADWFKVTLTAGQTYEFKLEGSDTGQGTLPSPYLELRDSAGNALLGDQLSGGSGGPGPGWTALLTYTATTTGTYHLASDPFGNDIGTYKISATQLFINAAPTLALDNEVTTLSENADTTNRVKVADITITDDGEGTNAVTLSGDDAALFEIDGAELFLKANTVLDYEGGNTTLDVTVEVDDPAVGSTPDASEALLIAVTDVNEAITNGNGGGTLAGTPGNDLIDGQGGNDRINAGAGNDTITGGPGLDIVNAGNGDDTIVAAIGDGSFDVYRAGAGIDTLDMSGITAAATVNLAFSFVSSSQTGWDALTSIENVIGGSGNDAITGNGVVNRLEGQGGNDTINAGGGNDVVIGGAGNDTMNGGPGNDLFIFGPGFENDRILGFDANPTGGQDLLDISAFGITSADFAARVTIADVGADTLVTIDGNAAETIRLVGIGDTTAATQADFVLLLS